MRTGRFLDAICVRMAAEGIPLMAISRATLLDAKDVIGILRRAVRIGIITQLPDEDWPEGRKRKPVPAPMPKQAIEDMAFIIRAKSALTPHEARFLAALLVMEKVPRPAMVVAIGSRGDVTSKTIDVFAFRVRQKIADLDVTIDALHGMGHAITPEDRNRLLLHFTGKTAAEYEGGKRAAA